MRKTDICFNIELDNNNYPEKITWKATDAEDLPGITKSISLNVWDHSQNNTLRIDLWTKEMRIDEMKKFFIDCLGGLGQTILNSTGDTYMSGEVNSLCEKLAKRLEGELKNPGNVNKSGSGKPV
jgi:gliding motility-associated protein GldC